MNEAFLVLGNGHSGQPLAAPFQHEGKFAGVFDKIFTRIYPQILFVNVSRKLPVKTFYNIIGANVSYRKFLSDWCPAQA